MSAIDIYPKVWKTHITAAGELYISLRFRPAKAVPRRNGDVHICCNVISGGAGEDPSPGNSAFFKTYLGLGIEMGKAHVPPGKTSAKVTLSRIGPAKYLLQFKQP